MRHKRGNFARSGAIAGLGEDVYERIHDHGLGDRLDEETIELQPLDDICKYAHHTMIAVDLRPDR